MSSSHNKYKVHPENVHSRVNEVRGQVDEEDNNPDLEEGRYLKGKKDPKDKKKVTTPPNTARGNEDTKPSQTVGTGDIVNKFKKFEISQQGKPKSETPFNSPRDFGGVPGAPQQSTRKLAGSGSPFRQAGQSIVGGDKGDKKEPRSDGPGKSSRTR